MSPRVRWTGLILTVACAAMGCQPVENTEPAGAAAARPVTVTKVVDGDTITVTTSSGQRERVRLLGIDTPELARDGQRAECGAEEAQQILTTEIDRGREVTLTTDPQSKETDRYGRTLAYVDIDGRDITLILLQGGYGRVWEPNNGKRYLRYTNYAQAAQEAVQAGRGPCR